MRGPLLWAAVQYAEDGQTKISRGVISSCRHDLQPRHSYMIGAEPGEQWAGSLCRSMASRAVVGCRQSLMQEACYDGRCNQPIIDEADKAYFGCRAGRPMVSHQGLYDTWAVSCLHRR